MFIVLTCVCRKHVYVNKCLQELNSMDIDSLYLVIGQKIRSRRKERDVSQLNLAKKLKISRTSVVNIEAGRQKAPIHVLWQLAETLETEIHMLIPKQSELDSSSNQAILDADTVRDINEAAAGDPQTKRRLAEFVSREKSRLQEEL